LEFLKLDKVIKKDFAIPLKITDLKPVKIKRSHGEYQEIYPKITNENIIVADKLITLNGDLSFEKGEAVIKTELDN
jgi:hypothetical protein